MQVWYLTVSLVTSSESKQKFVGEIFVGDTLLNEKFSWMEANHENNEIKSTTKIFMYMVLLVKYVTWTGEICIMYMHKPEGECGHINQIMTAHVTCVMGPVTINHANTINYQIFSFVL